MNFKLVILTILINIAFIIIYKIILDKFCTRNSQQNKNYLSALLGLNISHLHDAANFFALIKNQSEDTKVQNFAKGASFHFRSLFEELNQSKKTFDEMPSNQSDENFPGVLYHKEAIDLKDILELELLQLSSSSDNRLEIIDLSNAEHALSYGNFSLLSKVILNLVENALKYTERPIKLELHDSGNSWQIRVSSYGKSIPESLANAINNQIEDGSGSGHGLNSINQIMLFHNAELFIDTLADEGTSIRLIFKKYQAATTTAISLNNKPLLLKVRQKQIMLIIIGLIFISCSYIIYHNKVACQAYYQSFNKVDSPDIIQKERVCLQYLESMNGILVDDIPDELYLKYNVNTKKELLDKIFTEFIHRFSSSNQDLVSLIVFDRILISAPIEYQTLVETEAKHLIVRFPSAINLNLFLSNHYFENGRYGKAIIYSARSVIAFVESSFYIHPKLYLVSKLDKDHEDLSQFLATLYKEPKLTEQASIPLPKPELKETKKSSPKPIPTPKPKLPSSTPDEAVDKLIDEQDKELGLDLDL